MSNDNRFDFLNQSRPRFNGSIVKPGGRFIDPGAVARAIDIASWMMNQGVWDGQTELLIMDPYDIHRNIHSRHYTAAQLTQTVNPGHIVVTEPPTPPVGGGSELTARLNRLQEDEQHVMRQIADLEAQHRRLHDQITHLENRIYNLRRTEPPRDTPPQAKTATLTKAQQAVVDRLRLGWHINAPLYPGMTHWVRPDGRLMDDACPFPTLKALEKKGVVFHEDGEWRLTDAGRQRASEGGAR